MQHQAILYTIFALLCTHVKSTLPRDVWMVLNVCTVKMIDTNKIKELRLESTFNNKKALLYTVQLVFKAFGISLFFVQVSM